MRTQRIGSRIQQRGLSLIELMVALLLSTLLLLGVLQLFSNSSHSNTVSSALTRVQDSGRVVLDMMAEDARRAGYQGCALPSATSTLKVNNRPVFPDQAISRALNNNTQVTFYYASTATTGVAITDTKSCTNQNLFLYSVTYSNCADGTSICMNSSNSNGNQTIVDGARINDISLGYVDAVSGKTVWKHIGAFTDDQAGRNQLASVDRLQVSLTASDTTQNISRSFTSTIELRNRQ